jgi:hypothetical protein
MNPAYLKADNWGKIVAAMDADGSVQLKQFLKPQLAAAIAAAAKAQDAAEGVGGGKIPDFEAGYGPGACEGQGQMKMKRTAVNRRCGRKTGNLEVVWA